MRRFLTDWLFSRFALGEYARLAAAAVLFALYWYVAGKVGIVWVLPKVVLIVLVVPLIIRAIFYFVYLPLSVLADRLRDLFAKEAVGVPCPVCGYDIRETLHKCPECGTDLRWGQLPDAKPWLAVPGSVPYWVAWRADVGGGEGGAGGGVLLLGARGEVSRQDPTVIDVRDAS